jgi:DNA (cytosine-5)-methyltransferase 1
MRNGPIPVVDLFAGPGGLGEGFAAYRREDGTRSFAVKLSIEMDDDAHQTLELRSFVRQFSGCSIPDEYYEHLRGERTRQDLFAHYPAAAAAAREEAWQAELGRVSSKEVGRRIEAAIQGRSEWVLCGGPPCQAYSIVGRSRRGGINLKDRRLYLYREYLQIIAEHEPPVFIIENVKGLLSSNVKGNAIFSQMLDDLQDPAAAEGLGQGATYRIVPLVRPPSGECLPGIPAFSPVDYVIPFEEYGIPQLRHRVILLGIREDLADRPIPNLRPAEHLVSAGRVLAGLPPLRSGLSREPDSSAAWRARVASFGIEQAFMQTPNGYASQVRIAVCNAIQGMRDFRAGRGGEFVPCRPRIGYRPDWFLDEKLGGVCNHASRPHMAPDLHRYLYAACYASVTGRSPQLRDFPKDLLPEHKNVHEDGKQEYFDDRFCVQMRNRPAMTITCHIAKDGHYYIHPDASQCRSLTVREAARIQTFPDNYFFCGTRTSQYRQVGNAVPPLLAEQIAEVVCGVLNT